MIYLLETFTGILGETVEESQPVHALKIGYTNDDRGEGRFKDYTNAGLVIRVLKTIPGGSIKLEHILQRRFGEYRIPGRSIEWFFVNKEILDFFSNCKTDGDLLKKLGLTEKDLIPGEIRKPVTGFVDFFYKFEKASEDNLTFLPVLKRLDEMSFFSDRLRYICEEVIVEMDSEVVPNFISVLPILYQTLLLNLSLSELRSLSYRKKVVITKFETSIYNSIVEPKVSDKIYETFIIGEKYLLTDIKDTLGNIYKDCDMYRSPKATDLHRYFELKVCNILNPLNNKYDKGFEILSIKQ